MKKSIKSICTGCGLCHSVIGCELKRNEQGFYEPLLDNEWEEKVSNFCPMSYYKKKEEFSIWGKYLNTYEGYATNAKIRYEASSGGALTVLAIYLLENGYVDGIIQTKAKKDSPFETETIVSRCRREILNCMGSRYVESSPLMNLFSIIKDGEKYAFIGKPCDVHILQEYMLDNKKLKSQILITMSFFCAGVPSEAINKILVDTMGCNLGQLVELQYRGFGWPGFTTAKDNNGHRYKLDYQIAWGNYLGRDVRRRCKFCMDGIGEEADIVCADLWYLDENNKPDFSEHEGRNIIFCRSELSEKIVMEASSKGYLNVKRFTDEMEDFEKYQPFQFQRRTTMKYKILAMKLLGRSTPKYNTKLLNCANKYSIKKENWRIFKGTIKRIIQGKM